MSFDPATDYAKQVVSGEILACKYVVQAAERHLRDLQKDWDYVWKPEEAERFFRFCKYLKHYKGEKSGQSIELEPWQKFVFGSIYGWQDLDGNFRFRQVFISIPRKNGKTTMAAASALYDAAFIPGAKTGAECFVLATKEDQAKLLLNDCVAFINQSDELKKIFTNLVGRSTIFVEGTSRTSFIKPLGSDSKRLDGLNPFSCFMDELHAWKKSELFDVMEGAVGARKNWRMLSITTAGHDREGICYQERKHLTRILDQTIDVPEKFGIIYTVDDQDLENWKDERVWKIANPNLGTGKEIDYMKNQAKKVTEMPTKLNAFLRYQLNIWTDVAQAWLRIEQWNANEIEMSVDDLIGLKCWGGMDLAKVNDLSCCAYYFPKQDGLEKAVMIADFFVPDYRIGLREERDQVPFREWAKNGNMILTPGKTTDWQFIRQKINERHGQFAVQGFGYDRHFAYELVGSLEEDGITMTPFGMGFLSMASPTAEFERMVVGEEMGHLGCPIMAWNIANTIVRTDPAGNIKPDKQRSTDRIDGVVAAIIALGISMRQDKPQDSPYATRGVRVI